TVSRHISPEIRAGQRDWAALRHHLDLKTVAARIVRYPPQPHRGNVAHRADDSLAVAEFTAADGQRFPARTGTCNQHDKPYDGREGKAKIGEMPGCARIAA